MANSQVRMMISEDCLKSSSGIEFWSDLVKACNRFPSIKNPKLSHRATCKGKKLISQKSLFCSKNPERLKLKSLSKNPHRIEKKVTKNRLSCNWQEGTKIFKKFFNWYLVYSTFNFGKDFSKLGFILTART